MSVRVVDVAAPNCVRVERSAELADEAWVFVVGQHCALSLCYYSIAEGGAVREWDGMASQSQPRLRTPRPASVPREVALAAWEKVGFPVSPGVAS